MASYTLKEIAEELGGEVDGDAQRRVSDIGPLDQATESHLSFLANPKYEHHLEKTSAGGVIVMRDLETATPASLIRVDDPYLAFARAMRLFHALDIGTFRGLSPHAWVMEGAQVGKTATIYPGVYVGRESVVEEGAALFPGVFLGENVRVGEDSILFPGVSVYSTCQIGKRVIIHSNSVIGSDGFGFAKTKERRWFKILQIGRVIVEDDVEIGANVCIDRATLGETIIGRGTKIDNQVQVGHNVKTGRDCIIVSQAGISGSVTLGDRVTLAGKAGIVGHITLEDDTIVGARSTPTRDILEPGHRVTGFPAIEHSEWRRLQALQRRLPELLKRVEALEEQLKKS